VKHFDGFWIVYKLIWATEKIKTRLLDCTIDSW